MLAGRQVSQEMLYTVKEAKRLGQRCFLVSAGPLYQAPTVAAADCPNCEGYGRLALEVTIGGPFEDVPAAGERGEGVAKIYVSAAWHAGSWWQVVRSYCSCPVCSPTREIVL